MTESDIASLKHLSIDDLEEFIENLKKSLASQVPTGISHDWDLKRKKIDEEWLRHAENEILERSLGLK